MKSTSPPRPNRWSILLAAVIAVLCVTSAMASDPAPSVALPKPGETAGYATPVQPLDTDRAGVAAIPVIAASLNPDSDPKCTDGGGRVGNGCLVALDDCVWSAARGRGMCPCTCNAANTDVDAAIVPPAPEVHTGTLKVL